MGHNLFNTFLEFDPGNGKKGNLYCLATLEEAGIGRVFRLPFSIRIICPQRDITLIISGDNGRRREVKLLLRIDLSIEVDYFKHGGILPCVLRELIAGM